MVYVMPRPKRQKQPRFQYEATGRTKDKDEAARLLFASVIAGAVEDYLAGSAGDSEAARWYIAGEDQHYLRHAAALGLPTAERWPVPESMREFVISLE